jgi:hypothetical protein
LSSGLYMSCVAVDNAGTVWVSFASVLATEATGEFTNDHVYRLPAGSTTWLNCSAGLAQANPINAIAVDPSNPDLVFCGGDQSVFRWDATANSWELWDQGLPNSPIMSLALHGPSRLLRAATYGRGIWERAIDNSPEPLVDIYMRDNILDSARCPAPCPVPHPFNPANLVWWYQSEDITVDAPPFQTPLPAPDDITLANSVVDCNPKRGMVNRFYIQVHNRGPLKATNVRVRAFLADASLALPSLPSDFWSSPKPFDGDPSAAYWTPIGSTKSAGDLGPCKTAVLCWEWAVPATAAQHSCLLAIATCDEDVLNLPGHFDIGDVVINYNNVTLKNMAIIP